MIAAIFPGQGSQRRGMGQGLFDEVREYAALEPDVDRLVGYSMRQLCLDDPDNRLKETQYTQPALYVVNALHYYKAHSAGTRPDMVAGHSLGEYSALLVAGAFDFLTGLRLVRERGALMAKARDGGMAAVVGVGVERVADILRRERLESLDVANYNTPKQVVVSGPVGDIERAGPIFTQAGAMFFPLPVSAAFHSRYMTEASVEFERFLATVSFNALTLPVISNVSGAPYPGGGAAAIRDALVSQLRMPVLWEQSVRYMMRAGVTEFTEMGPGNVLTRLVQQIK